MTGRALEGYIRVVWSTLIMWWPPAKTDIAYMQNLLTKGSRDMTPQET